MPASPSSLDATPPWRQVVLGVVRHHVSTAAHLARVLEVAPRHVAALCLRGFALLFKGRRVLRPEARKWGERASAVLAEGGGGPGDAELVDALFAWTRDDCWGAEAALARRLEIRPDDLFTVKLQHGLLFMMGQSAVMRDRIEKHLARWPVDDPDRGYLLGATVFARVECADFDAAEVVQHQWAEDPPEDAWGLHAVAHLLHERGRFADALAWLDERTTRWAECDRFGNHLDWHRALLHLRLGGTDAAMALYDAHLRGVFDGDYRDMSNAVSILWRLEALGIDVGPRWDELAAVCGGYLADHGSAFADAHYLLAQLHGGEPGAAEAMLSSMQEVAGTGYQAGVVREVGEPLCKALASWRACPEEALGTLRTVASDLGRVGGSHAQRSLFEDVLAHLEP